MALWAVSAVSNAWNVVHWRAMLIEFETKGSHVKEKMYEFSGRRQFSVECISICTDSLSWKIRKKNNERFCMAWNGVKVIPGISLLCSPHPLRITSDFQLIFRVRVDSLSRCRRSVVLCVWLSRNGRHETRDIKRYNFMNWHWHRFVRARWIV